MMPTRAFTRMLYPALLYNILCRYCTWCTCNMHASDYTNSMLNGCEPMYLYMYINSTAYIHVLLTCQ